MPAFNPWAGPSPNCCAVLVQMEHCALAIKPGNENNKIKTKIAIQFLIYPICTKLSREWVDFLNFATKEFAYSLLPSAALAPFGALVVNL